MDIIFTFCLFVCLFVRSFVCWLTCLRLCAGMCRCVHMHSRQYLAALNRCYSTDDKSVSQYAIVTHDSGIASLSCVHRLCNTIHRHDMSIVLSTCLRKYTAKHNLRLGICLCQVCYITIIFVFHDITIVLHIDCVITCRLCNLPVIVRGRLCNMNNSNQVNISIILSCTKALIVSVI